MFEGALTINLSQFLFWATTTGILTITSGLVGYNRDKQNIEQNVRKLEKELKIERERLLIEKDRLKMEINNNYNENKVNQEANYIKRLQYLEERFDKLEKENEECKKKLVKFEEIKLKLKIASSYIIDLRAKYKETSPIPYKILEDEINSFSRTIHER